MRIKMSSEAALQQSVTVFTDITNRRNFSQSFPTEDNSFQGTVGPTPFHEALVRGNHAFFDLFVSRTPADVVITALNTRISWVQCSVATENPDLNSANLHKKLMVELPDDKQCDLSRSTLFCLPLSLAAVSGNKKLVQKVLENGANLLGVDDQGRNVVHDLVHLSHSHPKQAGDMYHFLLSLAPNDDDKERLLKAEDVQGRNCLDLACEKYLPEITLAILNTQGVYRHDVKDCLVHRHIYYDISDYERQKHTKVSPLVHIKSLTNEDVVRFDSCRFFETEPVRTWIKLTYKSNVLNIVIWMFTWTVQMGLFAAAQIFYVSRAPKETHDALYYALVFVAIICTIHEHHALGRMECKRTHRSLILFFKHGRIPATLTIIYRKVHAAFSYLCIALGVVELLDVECKNSELIQIMYLLAGFLGIMSIMYFVNMISSVGHLLVIVLKMAYDAAIFFVVGAIVFLAFANAFYTLSVLPKSCDVNTNETSAGFALSYTETMFETFLLVTSIKSPDEAFFADSSFPSLAQISYSAGIIYCSIILLNMLIGLMSQRITEIQEHKDTMIILERLSVMLFLRDSLWDKFRYEFGITQKYFRVSADRTKVFVEVIEPYMIPNSEI